MTLDLTPMDQHGFLITTNAIANPAAGANFTSPVTNSIVLLLLSVRFRLVTDATVASRYPRLIWFNGAVDYLSAISPTPVTASSDAMICFALGLHHATIPVSQFQLTAPLPDQIIAWDDYVFRSAIVNLQAGDQISEILVTNKRWLIPT